MTVTDLRSRRAAEFPPQHLPPLDQADSLIAIGRCWEQIVTVLSTGPDSLAEDEAEECVQHMAAALVHPAALPGLVFELPQLRELIRMRDRYRDGDKDPHDEDYESVEQAMAHHDRLIDLQLYPLVSGRPVSDACRECQRHCSSVTFWQPRGACTTHGPVGS